MEGADEVDQARACRAAPPETRASHFPLHVHPQVVEEAAAALTSPVGCGDDGGHGHGHREARRLPPSERPDFADMDPKQRRKEANKESARKSREKKKCEIDGIMAENVALKRQVAVLEYQLAVAEGRPAPPMPEPLTEGDGGEEAAEEEPKLPPKKQRRKKHEDEDEEF